MTENTFIISLAAVAATAILSTVGYMINEQNLLSKNISEAVAKGMDPMTVRCAYAHPQDAVCVSYIASKR